MKRLLGLFGAATISIAMPTAQAADLTRPVYKAAPAAVAPAYNWTGFYVGAHAGWARTDKRWFNPSGAALVSYDVDGVIGGGQAGFNWQTGNWVLGAEVQASWGDIRKGVPHIEQDNIFALPVNKRVGTTVDHLGTVAARGGYAFDNVLVFAKVGAAWAHDVYRDFNLDTVPETLVASASGTRWGWMVGVGVEYGFAPNWSAKIEFDYLDLGTQRITLTSVPGVIPATRAFDVEQTVALVKVGVNYRFGGPLVAKY